jgi:hypothetical protein
MKQLQNATTANYPVFSHRPEIMALHGFVKENLCPPTQLRVYPARYAIKMTNLPILKPGNQIEQVRVPHFWEEKKNPMRERRTKIFAIQFVTG